MFKRFCLIRLAAMVHLILSVSMKSMASPEWESYKLMTKYGICMKQGSEILMEKLSGDPVHVGLSRRLHLILSVSMKNLESPEVENR